MELIRKILMEIEQKESPSSWIELSYDDYSNDEINYHVKLLSEARLIVADFYIGGHSTQRLTWEGHEFLESIKKFGTRLKIQLKKKVEVFHLKYLNLLQFNY
ncbi:DUF2513 domain-containing protein [Niallia oryzisoli]|uniref:DUF2513 domain-containing protein n=1 Tax=Niallia oryzisoli TaxID=1737571 RepID=A0ABZ2CKE0_9BACI